MKLNTLFAVLFALPVTHIYAQSAETTAPAEQATETTADYRHEQESAIEWVLQRPLNPTSNDDVYFSARVGEPADVAAIELLCSENGGTSESVPAFDDGERADETARDGIFSASIPRLSEGAKVAAQFILTRRNGDRTETDVRTYTVQEAPRPEFRVMQVDSWAPGILTKEQVENIVATCRAANLNVIQAEVRKVGDADYVSLLEPKATNVEGDFDPLAHILKVAHDTSGGKKRIGLHAWFVMHRISKSEELSPQHILSRHPEFEMLKQDGSRNEGNRYLDPGHPGVVEHNIAVILDCMRRYDIDGINCDYIRYPEDPGGWGYNPVSVARFNKCNNTTGTPDQNDPLWQAWRRECVSLELKKLYVKAWQLRPEVLVTCDTINWGFEYDNYEKSAPYIRAYQDWGRWLDDTLMDYNCLMNYARLADNKKFYGWTEFSMKHDDRRGSIIGVGAYLHDKMQGTMDQLLWLREKNADGFFIYDWGSEVAANKEGKTREEFYAELTRQVTPTWADQPEVPWKQNPKVGIVEGTVFSEGSPLDHATVELEGRPETKTVTDGSGWYAILNVEPGDYTATFSHPQLGEKKKIRRPVSVERGGEFATVNIGQ